MITLVLDSGCQRRIYSRVLGPRPSAQIRRSRTTIEESRALLKWMDEIVAAAKKGNAPA
jgi:hypothetical protein